MEKLLERERELAAVNELLERGGVLLVEGRAGIGKPPVSIRSRAVRPVPARAKQPPG